MSHKIPRKDFTAMEKANLIPTKHEFIEELTEEDVIQNFKFTNGYATQFSQMNG